MLVLYMLAYACLTVNSVPLDKEKSNDLPIRERNTLDAVLFYTKVVADYQTTAKPASLIKQKNRKNGVDGWYIPLADGSLKWLDMDAIKIIQFYQNDVQNATNFMMIDSYDFDDYEMTDNHEDDTIKYYFYSAEDPNNGMHITDPDDIPKFNPEYTTVFVPQSFLQTKDSLNFNTTLKNALFEMGKFNFIYIEWLEYFRYDYIGASLLVPDIGNVVAGLFDVLIESQNMDCEKTHFIGHGLGAHIVGFAAKNVQSCKVPKITALDPALPLFAYDKPDQRLNSSDARYVESIQTDGGFYGYEEPVGVATFYCNGGKEQPGCSNSNACNHERSIKVFQSAMLLGNVSSESCGYYINSLRP